MANMTGGQKGAIMTAINKYRNLAKQYPKTAGFAKAALVAVAGLATGGAGLPAIAGLTYALDSAIKGDKLSSVLGKGVGTAALAAAGQGIFGGATQTGAADTTAFTNVNQMGDYTGEYVSMPDGSDAASALVAPTPDLAAYTVQQGDTLSQIAERFNTTVEELVGLNPQLAQASGATGGQGLNPDVIFPGQQITLPPGTPGADVYAGGVGTNANTMADIASGQVPDSAITQGMAAKGQAAADAVSGRADNLANMTQQAGGVPIDYSLTGPMSTDSLGQKLEFGIPVTDTGNFVPPNPNLPADELAKQTAAYNSWKADFMKRNPNIYIDADGNQMQIMTKPTLPAVQESIKFKIIPAEQLIDHKLTVLSWALNESVNRKGQQSVQLTPKGVRTVFENIGRCRRAYLKEYIGAPTADYGHPTAAGAPASATAGQGKPQGWFGKTLDTIGRGVDKVGGYVSNVGHNVITKVTADKLNNMWNRAGEPYDSDRLYQLLTTEWGVPKQVVDSVFSKMSIPYTAPATVPAAKTAAPKTGGASTQAYAGINPATKKPWTQQELRDKFYPEPAATDATDDAEDTTGGGTGAFSSMAGQLAKPSTTSSTGGTTSVDQAKGITTNRASANNPNRQAATAAGGTGTKTTTSPSLTPSFSSNPTDMKVTYGSGFKPTTATLPAGGGAGVKAAAQTKPGFLQTATDKIAAKSKTQSMNSNDTQAEIKAGLAARQAAGLGAYESKTNGSRIFQALKRPVTEMLQMVETKEDVQRIKQFVDDTFIKYGAVNESAFAVRNRIIEHVTQTGAQRRREYSQRVAT
jgi:LysM repeat protein